MPYIKSKQRVDLDEYLQPILLRLSDVTEYELEAGQLNYFISSIIWTIFDRDPCYSAANGLVGVLECVKQEFIRRKLNPYENLKLKENGDI